MTYRPGLIDSQDIDELRAALPDGYAYGQFQSDLPILHAYHLDPVIAETCQQLAAAGVVSLVDRFRMLVLKQLLLSTAPLDGEVWELGVYRGGTAALIRNTLAATPPAPRFRMFDTFSGMPATDPARDLHRAGDFADVSLADVQALVGADPFLDFRPGLVPETLVGLEDRAVRFAHVDLDIHAPIAAAIAFIFPRMPAGGIMLFDDYGFATCPGARLAIDEAFRGRSIPVIVLPTGQAFVIKR